MKYAHYETRLFHSEWIKFFFSGLNNPIFYPVKHMYVGCILYNWPVSNAGVWLMFKWTVLGSETSIQALHHM